MEPYYFTPDRVAPEVFDRMHLMSGYAARVEVNPGGCGWFMRWTISRDVRGEWVLESRQIMRHA